MRTVRPLRLAWACVAGVRGWLQQQPAPLQVGRKNRISREAKPLCREGKPGGSVSLCAHVVAAKGGPRRRAH